MINNKHPGFYPLMEKETYIPLKFLKMVLKHGGEKREKYLRLDMQMAILFFLKRMGLYTGLLIMMDIFINLRNKT